jgi:hypothetical protein
MFNTVIPSVPHIEGYTHMQICNVVLFRYANMKERFYILEYIYIQSFLY